MDYLLTNAELKNHRAYYYQELSDHLIFTLSTTVSQAPKKKIITFNRLDLIDDLKKIIKHNPIVSDWTDYILMNSHTYQQTLSLEKYQKTSLNQLPPNPNIKEVTRQWLNEFKALSASIPAMRFSDEQGRAFELLRKTSKYDQFERRDGGIISSLKTDAGIMIDPKKIDESLTTFLKDNESVCQSLNRATEELGYLSDLPLLTETQIRSIFKKISTNKALAKTPVPDQIIKLFESRDENHFEKSKSPLLDANVWNQVWTASFWNKYQQLLDCRLIPLNKVYPKVPTPSDMRPIVITNVIYKVMETRFLETLQEKFFALEGIAKSQLGFLPRMSTQSCILRLLQNLTSEYTRHNNEWKLRNTASRNLKPYVLYIDFEQAYNSINLGRLKESLENNNILPLQELNFIFKMITSLVIYIGDSNFKPRHGVPQGGIISPILFNFAMNFYLTEVLDRLRFEGMLIEPKQFIAWADDLAITLRLSEQECRRTVPKILSYLVSYGREWGLRIKFKKSALQRFNLLQERKPYENLDYLNPGKNILWDSNKQSTSIPFQLDLLDQTKLEVEIPFVFSYKYLGVHINSKLRIDTHLKKTKLKINYLSNALWSSKKEGNSLQFNHNMWTTFIRPLLDYSQTYLAFCSNTCKTDMDTLYRTSMRKMVLLKDYVRLNIIERLINYNYKSLHQEYVRIALLRLNYRLTGRLDTYKINWDYGKLCLQGLNLNWSKVVNFVYVGKQPCVFCPNPKPLHNVDHFLMHLNDFKIHLPNGINLGDFIINCITLEEDTSDQRKELSSHIVILDKIYNLIKEHL